MSSDLREFIVESDQDQLRLDIFLGEQLDMTRSYIQKLVKNGCVSINSKPVKKAGEKLKSSDSVQIDIPEPEVLSVEPEKMDLNIVFEDDDLIVVDKPKGLVVHPSISTPNHTLVNGLMYHCADNLSGINGVMRPGIVHRIDKNTTGLLIVCKSDAAHTGLAKQFAEHTITRRYYAIVCDNLNTDEGTVDTFLGRNPKDRKKMAVFTSDNGSVKHAVTHYRVLDHLNNRYNYIECRLETGRTHQIRVHMSHIHHPVLGDDVYGGARPGEFSKLEGQTLHAGILGFTHPVTNQYMEFKSELPQYFENVLNKLKNK
ncbi:MAG: RluA family pseudouridine synthase [Eubacterium sp.]|nr:RluA family pseudouridine synthase [Eubacterium sp.]